MNGERLGDATLSVFPPIDAQVFEYDRAAQEIGMVHFGLGAFHRAHQAWYTDLAMDSGDRDWGIAGVSLRSGGVAEQLNPQDGLFTVTERSVAGAKTRAVGSVREVLVAPSAAARIAHLLGEPSTRIASFTVTEKGYCRAPDGSLDFSMAGPGSFYCFVAEGLRRRCDAGRPGLTLLSCDNLADNGRQLADLMAQYLDRHDPALVAWFERECTCPATMVDRIVPATTEADRAAVAIALGDLRDEAAVVTEPFSQWVIEDRFAGSRPAWEKVGAELVADVASYETAKLKMLNGAHSALAYLGLERGYGYVHEAVADPQLRALASTLMRDEAAPTIAAAPGQDLAAYAEALLARFANPALDHRLIQIAMDGSQKIPQRWLATLADNRARGRSCPVILTALAAWLRHVRGDNRPRWGPVDDPLAGALADLRRGADQASVTAALFGPGGRFAAGWTMTESDENTLASRFAH